MEEKSEVVIRKSQRLWRKIFFAAFIIIGLLHFLLRNNSSVPDERPYYLLWVIRSLSIIVASAFVVSLPLFIPKHAIKIAITLIGISLGLIIMSYGPYFGVFLVGYFPYILAIVVCGLFLPIFLQRKIILQQRGTTLATIFYTIELIIILGIIIYPISYTATLLEQSSEASACSQLRQITLWANALRPAYRTSCPQMLSTTALDESQPYPYISSDQLKKAFDDCKVNRVFEPLNGLKGVCLTDGNKYLTNDALQIPPLEPPSFVSYKSATGKLCQLQQNSTVSEQKLFEHMSYLCKAE